MPRGGCLEPDGQRRGRLRDQVRSGRTGRHGGCRGIRGGGRRGWGRRGRRLSRPQNRRIDGPRDIRAVRPADQLVQARARPDGLDPCGGPGGAVHAVQRRVGIQGEWHEPGDGQRYVPLGLGQGRQEGALATKHATEPLLCLGCGSDHFHPKREDGKGLGKADRGCRHCQGEAHDGTGGEGFAQRDSGNHGDRLLAVGLVPVGHGVAAGQRALPDECA